MNSSHCCFFVLLLVVVLPVGCLEKSSAPPQLEGDQFTIEESNPKDEVALLNVDDTVGQVQGVSMIEVAKARRESARQKELAEKLISQKLPKGSLAKSGGLGASNQRLGTAVDGAKIQGLVDPSKLIIADESHLLNSTDKSIVTFTKLASFKYIEPDPGKPESVKKSQIPADILALHGKQVTMEGYMIPLDMSGDGKKIRSFFLARTTLGCCFGQLPEINEVVEVSFEEPVRFLPDVLIRLKGRMEVGEEFDQYGYLMNIFRIKGETVLDPWRK